MKLIKLQDKFILVSDEDAKNNELLYNIENNTICRAMCNAEVSHFKIIAGVEFLPKVDFSLLKEEDCKRIGWVDVEKLAMDKTRNLAYGGVTASRSAECFIWKSGFKAAQSLNNKMFSLEDMANYLSYVEDNFHYHSDTWHDRDTDEPIKRATMLFNFKKSLQQTSWDVEVNELNQITKIL